ncbi:hypothetical protein GUITHDRAFT_141817 [Guillardia theta CCMP2712]|uniref:Uncharacterized protein n=1 Tax=Guillardia theta (strain CCMP2712) TaxID=905079 RepID=L1J0D2_GUITC|nr:hypothetical protein GUITHDRAFT_141817 [Guillardia theta CCMP2712]EKX41550.1 hypothetical protein GUITHDRAFT_141817 [Guillardia theta CCMP2712]|eukprot:XP_005828530.1 hypothetical protein GUITHDRAFT_141817 [Guillardia theta CCMP2712]
MAPCMRIENIIACDSNLASEATSDDWMHVDQKDLQTVLPKMKTFLPNVNEHPASSGTCSDVAVVHDSSVLTQLHVLATCCSSQSPQTLPSLKLLIHQASQHKLGGSNAAWLAQPVSSSSLSAFKPVHATMLWKNQLVDPKLLQASSGLAAPTPSFIPTSIQDQALRPAKRLRSQTLTAKDAVEIYSKRPAIVSAVLMNGTHAAKFAKAYHVATNTIRDIWNRRSWVTVTYPYWTPEEHKSFRHLNPEVYKKLVRCNSNKE